MSQDVRGRGCLCGIFFLVSTTLDIFLSDSANCTVLRAVVLTQYWRVTDRRTDGIAIASTALAMRYIAARCKKTLECGPMPNVMAALPNIAGAVCSTPQSLIDAHY